MSEEAQSVRSRLLDAGKKAFLEQGYGKSSLRKICAAAGVTTGALYFFFESKADLFDQVVGKVVVQLKEMSRDMIEKELEDPSVAIENEKRLLEFLWSNREVAVILMDKSEGTVYEGFSEELVRGLETAFGRFFAKQGSAGAADPALIRILVKMKLQGYMELLTGGYTLERTLELAEMLGWYTDGGFTCLTEKLNHRM